MRRKGTAIAAMTPYELTMFVGESPGIFLGQCTGCAHRHSGPREVPECSIAQRLVCSIVENKSLRWTAEEVSLEKVAPFTLSIRCLKRKEQ